MGWYELAPDGSYAKGKLLNTGITETWEQPVDCQARDADGNPLDQYALAPATGGFRCLEAPMMGMQFQTGFATLDGNYGFGTIFPDGLDLTTFEPINPANEVAMPANDYLVEVVIPSDDFGRPKYKVVREEDINVFGGDEFIPQVPPPACVGALHTVDVAGVGADGPDAVDNPSFADAGGSPFEGMQKPLCDVKLVTVNNGKSIAPTFNFFTEVPIPGKWKGYIIDDLTLSTNPQELFFGEKAPFPNAPVGIYDFTNRLVTTVQSDPNGTFEVLLPSTWSINCPTPSGVCPGTYFLLGNDPGQPGRLNPNYNPQYRTIGASFEIWPGTILPSDLAPTQIGVSILAPGSNVTAPAQCRLDAATPQLFAVSQPYVDGSGAFTISGQGFGAQGAGSRVTLDGTIVLPFTAWSDTQIGVNVPPGTPVGPHQLKITADNGRSTVNGLTFHVRGGAYSPSLYEVGPGRTYATIQAAIDAAAVSPEPDLVVVYPGATAQWNPLGVYYENLVIYAPVKLQGVGPGGVRPDGSSVLGSVVDGVGVTGDTAYAEAWRVFVEGLTWDGNQTIYEGPVVYVLVQDGEFTAGYPPAIDGFAIQGGDQQAFPNFLPGAEPGAAGIITVQGGGIFANAYARNLQITNNVIRSNGGAYAGAIRLGTPHLPGAANDNQNDSVRIANNRIYANGGTNLAGAIGLFSGSEGYEVAYNDICGNFSAEYGGGISHYGYSPNGKIHHNRIYFNRSYDEGGGVMIAGELPADPATLSPGAGPVDVYANLIQANLGNDDGGGLRFLMAGNYPYNVYNNIVVNNVSTHEGGGISLNDAPNVRVYNNTLMKNITTATAVTSNGQPAPAGLSSSRNSALLQASLPAGSPIFSNPLLFNNIFWDNRAGTWNGGFVSGVGMAGDATPLNFWDLGVADGTGLLAPTNSLMQVDLGTIADASNTVGQDPGVVAPYDTSIVVLPWRGNARFVDTLLVAVSLPVEQMGDYHLGGTGSPAYNLGAASKSGVNAPATDIDDQARPAQGGFDSGADEFGGTTPPPATALYFSTFANTNVPGVGGTADDADIYLWNGTAFSRAVDVTTIGVPGGANVDGLVLVDATHFYLSFSNASTTLPGLGSIFDEDVVYYDNGTWSGYFNGTAQGLTAAGQDLDAISIVGGVLYFSTVGNTNPPGVGGTADDADIYAWTGLAFNRVIDVTTIGVPGGANVDGLVLVDATHFYVSFSNDSTTLPVIGAVQDEDVVYYNNGAWSVHFDGTARGLTAAGHDLDAISFVASTAPAFPTTGVLDNFNRADGPVGANWQGATNNFSIVGNQVNVGNTANMRYMTWSTAFGGNQEAFLTFTQVSPTSPEQGLLLKDNGGDPDATGTSVIQVSYNATNNSVQIFSHRFGPGWVVHANFNGITFAAGDQFGARAQADGTVSVFKNGVLIGSTRITTGTSPWPASLAAGGGSIGVFYLEPSPPPQSFDNFGGGTMP
jgi:hypothetical protein